MSDDIKLTLDGLDDTPHEEESILLEEKTPQKEIKLTEAEQRQVDEFAKTIDLTNSSVVLQYGVGAQKRFPPSPKRRWNPCARRISAR